MPFLFRARRQAVRLSCGVDWPESPGHLAIMRTEMVLQHFVSVFVYTEEPWNIRTVRLSHAVSESIVSYIVIFASIISSCSTARRRLSCGIS
jgi:hypothetical protein